MCLILPFNKNESRERFENSKYISSWECFEKLMFRIKIKTASFFTLLILFSSCATQNLEVMCVCEEGLKSQDTIKWEVFPNMDGKVDVYASNTPDAFNLSFPLTTARIGDRMALVPKLTDNRKYFMLVFDNKTTGFCYEPEDKCVGSYQFSGYRRLSE